MYIAPLTAVVLSAAYFVFEVINLIQDHKQAKKISQLSKIEIDRAWHELEDQYGKFREVDMSTFRKLLYNASIGYAFWQVEALIEAGDKVTAKYILIPVPVARAKMVLKIRNRQKYQEEFGARV